MCGKEALNFDDVMRLHKVQVWRRGIEEAAVAVYLVSDGVDRCRVGFLNCSLIVEDGAGEKYNGQLVQVVEFLEDSNEADVREFSEKNAGANRAVFIKNKKHFQCRVGLLIHSLIVEDGGEKYNG